MHFGRPCVAKLVNLLTRFKLENVDVDPRVMLEDTTRRCKPYQTYAQAPRRFKFALREDKIHNDTVFVDILYIESKPILQIVNESTRYQATL